MQTRYIPAITMLVAGAVATVSSIVQKFDILYSLKILFVVLIIFYIIGIIAKIIINKVIQSADSDIIKENQAEMEEEHKEDAEI